MTKAKQDTWYQIGTKNIAKVEINKMKNLRRILVPFLALSLISFSAPAKAATLTYGAGTSSNSCATDLDALTGWLAVKSASGTTSDIADDQPVNAASGDAGDMYGTGGANAAVYWKIASGCAYFKFMLDTTPFSGGKLIANTQYLLSLGTPTDGALAWVGVAIDGGSPAKDGNPWLWVTNNAISGGKSVTGTTFYFSKQYTAASAATATSGVYGKASGTQGASYVAFQVPLSTLPAEVTNGVGLFAGTASNSSLSAINNDCYGDQKNAPKVSCDVTASTFTNLEIVYLNSNPSLSPSSQTITGTKGVALTATPQITPINFPDACTGINFTIDPALPAALSMDPATGIITGTPSASQTETSYTITGSGTGASCTTVKTETVKITVLLPSISPSQNISVAKNSSLTTSAFTTTNFDACGTVTYSISPALSTAGISFDTSTGIISGIPTALLASTSYTVTATAPTTCTATATVTLRVYDDTLPSIPNATINGTVGVTPANTTTFPTSNWTGCSGTTYSLVTDDLATYGLTFDPATGTVSGRPTGVKATTIYTVTATSSVGGCSASANLTVTVVAPSMTPNQTVSGSAGSAITSTTAFTKTNFGACSGTVTYAIAPALTTAGLSFSTTTGIVSGTPTESLSSTVYTVTATQSATATATGTCSATATITISVGSGPSFTPTPQNYSGPKNSPITPTDPLVPNNFVGCGTLTYTVSPTLPNNLSIDADTGVISGTPASEQSNTAYTITGTDGTAGCSATAIVNIEVTNPGGGGRYVPPTTPTPPTPPVTPPGNPNPGGRFTPTAPGNTNVVLDPPPPGGKTEIIINGNPVCTTTTGSCSVPALLGPKAKIEAVTTNPDGTQTKVVLPAYAPEKPIPALVVYFPLASSKLTKTEIKKLDNFVKLMKEQGFTRVVLEGHTDVQGTATGYDNKTLSKNRSDIVAKYLSKFLKVKVAKDQFADTKPAVQGSGEQVYKNNRRTEVLVW